MKRFFSLPVVLVAILAIATLGVLAFRFVALDTPLEGQASDYGAADVPLEFHYTAFHSVFLSPDVIRLYGIERDERVGVAVVSVYQKHAPGVGVQAQVNGTKTNLSQQMDMLRFNEIREGEAVYYISTFPFTPEEHLTFEVDVQVVQTGEVRNLRWRQQFW